VGAIARTRAAELVLAVFMVGAALWLWHYARLNVAWGNDEEAYRHWAQWIALDPLHLFDIPGFDRGFQRLHLVLLAPPFAFFRSPAALEAAHLLQVVAYLSAAVPVFLLARGAGLRRPAAVAAAVVAVVTPWTVYSLTLLSEPLAFAMVAWTMWAFWRAAVVPSLGRDMLLLVVLGLLVTTRVAFIVVGPMVPLALFLHTWRNERSLRAIWDQRRLWVVLAAAGLVVGIADLIVPGQGLKGLIGAYSASTRGVWNVGYQADRIALGVSRAATGLAFIPIVLGLPWLVRELVRPRSNARWAFALTILLGLLAALVSTTPATSGATPEVERYYLYLAIPMALAVIAALDDRDLGRAWILAGGAVAVWMVLGGDWRPRNESDYRFFAHPAESFLLRGVYLRLSVTEPFRGHDPATVVAIALGAVAILTAAASRTRAAAAVFTALLLALVANGLVQSRYTLRHYVYGAGMGLGTNLADRAWVDRALPEDQTAAMYAFSRGAEAESTPIWRALLFFNTAVRQILGGESTGALPVPLHVDPALVKIDPATGLLRATEPIPRWVVAARTFRGTGLNWEPVVASPYQSLELMKLNEPPQALWDSTPLGAESSLPPGQPFGARFWKPPGPGPWCGILEFLGPAAANPADAKRAVRWRLTQNGRPVADGKVIPGERALTEIPLDFGAGSVTNVRLETRGAIDRIGGIRAALDMGAIGVQRCKG
jgi:hypothetical protein